MDRERLKEVHQTDLTESRINEDFLDWLKTKGPSWLLAILIGVTAYLGMVRWRQHQQRKEDVAWAALSSAVLPSSKEDVAAEHADIFAVPQLALEEAAVQLLRAVQTGQPLDQAQGDDPLATPDNDPSATLSDEDREAYLVRADRLYERVVADDDGTLGWTLHALHAINGRATIAESRGDFERARALYQQAAQRAERDYPDLATQARSRAQSLDDLATPVEFPAAADLPTAPSIEDPFAPAFVDGSLRELLQPPADDDG